MNLIEWTWCLPQNIAGLIVAKVTKARKNGDHYRYDVENGSVSLGQYIFICPSCWNKPLIIKHEQGHHKQSLILGWFYFLVIGLPSILWLTLGRKFREKHNVSYYAFYTEKWANKLSHIEIE